MTRPRLLLNVVVPATTFVLVGLGLLLGSGLIETGVPPPVGVALAVVSAAVVPALWLIRQSYVYRRRSDDERRIWQTFAEATRELNRLEPADAAVAGVSGALRLFPAYQAQLLVIGTNGDERSYCGEPGGPVTECGRAELDNDPNLAIRTLFVGGVHVGELQLRLRPPALLRNRDLLMFAAYGDALAAALHDAAAHHELREMTERTNHDAAHDPLTGLPNRGGFVARGEAALRELPAAFPVALLLFDLDRFREVNDTLGHAAGDELLNIAASRLTSALGPTELPGRLGGDEFAVLLTALPGDVAAMTGTPPMLQALPGVAAVALGELAGAEHPAQLAYVLGLARRMAEALAMPSEVADVQLSVEASVGVVVAPASSADLIELLRRADVAMYQAKRGGSSVAWYDASRDPASTDRLALLAEMREALSADDQLVLLLQPTVGLGSGGAMGAEALVRWQHPRRGTLEPAEFVKIVEHSELIRPFTRYVLNRALAIAADWAKAGVDLPISVNLAPRCLLDRRLPDDVQALLDRHGVRPDHLVLEITETVMTSESTMIDDVLRQLRDKGVQLAVDDFGTGYSSLTFLARVPVDELKVDPTFICRMIDTPEAAAIVRTTVDLGRRLGIRVVAEGVETPEQVAILTDLGCTAAQGYQFHPPLNPDRALEVLLKLGKAKLRLLREDAG